MIAPTMKLAWLIHYGLPHVVADSTLYGVARIGTSVSFDWQVTSHTNATKSRICALRQFIYGAY